MKAFSIIILLALISCHPSKEERQSLSFSKKEFVTEPCSAEPCAKVRIGWEEAVGADAGTHINKTVLSHLLAYFRQDTVFADLETAAKDFVASYNRFKQDFPDSPGGWTIEIDSEKTYESDSLVSIKFTEFNFTGGAHPNSSVNFLNFDKNSGSLLSEEQLILDQEKFLELAEQAFREYHQVEEGVALKDDVRFFLPDTGFFIPNAFGYEGDKLKLIYIPYEIGPYSLGYTELEFGLDELEGMVKK